MIISMIFGIEDYCISDIITISQRIWFLTSDTSFSFTALEATFLDGSRVSLQHRCSQ